MLLCLSRVSTFSVQVRGLMDNKATLGMVHAVNAGLAACLRLGGHTQAALAFLETAPPLPSPEELSKLRRVQRARVNADHKPPWPGKGAPFSSCRRDQTAQIRSQFRRYSTDSTAWFRGPWGAWLLAHPLESRVSTAFP